MQKAASEIMGSKTRRAYIWLLDRIELTVEGEIYKYLVHNYIYEKRLVDLASYAFSVASPSERGMRDIDIIGWSKYFDWLSPEHNCE